MFAAAAVVTVFLLDVVVFARAKVKDLLVHSGSAFVDKMSSIALFIGRCSVNCSVLFSEM